MDRPEAIRPDFVRKIPDGADRERSVCTRCGFIDYDNPRIIVGSVVTCEDKILLCRRAIDPRSGYWTLPAGYMELGETAEEGAAREAREEAGAVLTIRDLLAIYSLPHISQVQMIFRATLDNPDTMAAGPESAEIGLFVWADIPWDALAFPSVAWALRHHHEARDQAVIVPFGRPTDGL